MATLRTLLTASLRKIGVIPHSSAVPDWMLQQAKTALNYKLDEWNADSFTMYNTMIRDFPLVAGKGCYTLGPNGDFNIDANDIVRMSALNSISPAPAPTEHILFSADFTTYSDGVLTGMAATEFDSDYSTGIWGNWPSNAPLYYGDPWPEYWYGSTVPEFTDQGYISGGRAYFDNSTLYPGLPVPLFIPLDILNNGVRVTIKYIPVATQPVNPYYRSVPNLLISCITNDVGGQYSNAEVFYSSPPENNWLRDYSDYDWDGFEDEYELGQPIWGAVEHTLVYTISSAGRLGLTLDGVPLGPQTLVPWFDGYEPLFESYVWIGDGGEGESINSFGYTFVEVVAL
jgi:hypothetical protein